MLESMWSEGNTPPLLVGIQTCTTTLKIGMMVSQKVGNQPSSGPSNTTFGHTQKMLINTTKAFVQLCSWQHYL